MKYVDCEPVTFDPMNRINIFSNGFRSIFNELAGLNFDSEFAFKPNIDISEDSENIYFQAEVPGISKNDFKISLQDNILTVIGEKKKSVEQKELMFYHSERMFGQFKRSFSLPQNIDAEKIQAKSEDGILLITVPKINIDRNVERMIEIK